jgi:hypothetical protein
LGIEHCAGEETAVATVSSALTMANDQWSMLKANLSLAIHLGQMFNLGGRQVV